MKKEDMLKCFDGMCLFLANHGWTERDERAVAIRVMLQKPEVTEEWIEEKAKKVFGNLDSWNYLHPSPAFEQIKGFIRSLVKEISA